VDGVPLTKLLKYAAHINRTNKKKAGGILIVSDMAVEKQGIYGHVFIAFLSLYIHCKLEQHLKNAKTWARHDHGGSKECDGPG